MLRGPVESTASIGRRIPLECLILREELARTLLLTLEFLIAADVIYTIAVEQTFSSLGMLALLVVIRTFLSFSLQLELTGRWPWHGGEETPGSREAP